MVGLGLLFPSDDLDAGVFTVVLLGAMVGGMPGALRIGALILDVTAVATEGLVVFVKRKRIIVSERKMPKAKISGCGSVSKFPEKK